MHAAGFNVWGGPDGGSLIPHDCAGKRCIIGFEWKVRVYARPSGLQERFERADFTVWRAAVPLCLIRCMPCCQSWHPSFWQCCIPSPCGSQSKWSVIYVSLLAVRSTKQSSTSTVVKNLSVQPLRGIRATLCKYTDRDPEHKADTGCTPSFSSGSRLYVNMSRRAALLLNKLHALSHVWRGGVSVCAHACCWEHISTGCCQDDCPASKIQVMWCKIYEPLHKVSPSWRTRQAYRCPQ